MLEGRRLVADAIDAGASVALAFLADGFADSHAAESLLEKLGAQGTPIYFVDEALMATITGVEQAPGIVAVAECPLALIPDKLDLVLVVDSIRDPGNLGSLLRTALAAGVDAALLAPGTVDATSPKVVRSAMGAHFRLPIVGADWVTISKATRDLSVWIADAGGREDYLGVDWRAPVALVVSSEASGPSDSALGLGHTLRIDMPGAAESLNAAAAAAVILFEAVRQRRAPAD